MYPILILREEIVCLVILLFLTFISRKFRMGTDGRLFNRLLSFAMLHVIMDIFTVWTVNHLEVTPGWINDIAHIVFYLAAILFADEIFVYVVRLFRPKDARKWHLISLLPVAVYLLCLPFLSIEYTQCEGTRASTGSAAIVGYAIAFLYFLGALAILLRNWKTVDRHIKVTLIPMLLILLVAETAQIIVRELLFTGGAVTIITLGFFFSLENPAMVLQRKVMMDAMTGVENRNSYESDIREFDREFEKNPNLRMTFLFADINNLRSVNGLYGHQEGDEYISMIAVTLLNNLKSAEHIYRMGGDEFLAIYREADEQTVIRDIFRIREELKKAGEDLQYRPALAIGYAVSGPMYRSLHDVLRVADYMMYRNKAELKRELALEANRSLGTRLNLTGLTDRLFDAMCQTSEAFYPFMMNLETGVTRIAPAWNDFFDMGGEFFNDFADVWQTRVHPDDLKDYSDDITATLSGKKQYHFCVYRARGKNGEYVSVTCRGGVYHGRDGAPDIFSGYMVNHGAPEISDPVTGMKNFTMLYERLDEALMQGRSMLFLQVELNNLSRIRMMYGNESGHLVQRQLGELIQRETGETGETFSSQGVLYGILLPGADREAALALYHRIRRACVHGLEAKEKVIPMSISGGAVQMPCSLLKDRGAVRSAVLYAIEESRAGHNELVFFRDMRAQRSGAFVEEMAAVHQDCVRNREKFFLRYQPVIDSEGERMIGAEALLRWQNAEGREIPPTAFIEALENDPGYTLLGDDILRRALREAKRIREKHPDFRISVNITAQQLYEEGFVDRVTEILGEEDYPPDRLVLELTERCKELDFEFLKARTQALREKGILIALDDMGTGFSTINLLLHLDVDEVKLDSGFTRTMGEDPMNGLYARMVCEAAGSRGMDVCFEGVETREMLSGLAPYGRVLVQGYYFDRPLLPEEFEDRYLESGTAVPAGEAGNGKEKA